MKRAIKFVRVQDIPLNDAAIEGATDAIPKKVEDIEENDIAFVNMMSNDPMWNDDFAVAVDPGVPLISVILLNIVISNILNN